MFARERKRNGPVVFREHAWDMGWCDPCSAEPLSNEELRELGVWWLAGAQGGGQAFVTRLHVRYDAQSFPEDLAFQVTGDRTNFQGRYVMRHPWQGSAQCEAATRYRRELRRRQEREAATLAELTGWDIARVRAEQELPAAPATPDDEPWWRAIWPGGR